jgi:HK97 family phage prohead protease
MTIRKLYNESTTTLADKRQVRVICSTGAVDRAGEVIAQDGISLTAYRLNPIVLWQHNPDQPIARALEIGVINGALQALVQFPPEGTSAKADEVYGLIKAGVVNATSVGFDPLTCEPMDPARPRGPQRFLKSELMEFSFVSVPANAAALIVARQHSRRDQEVLRAKRKRFVTVLRLAGPTHETLPSFLREARLRAVERLRR